MDAFYLLLMLLLLLLLHLTTPLCLRKQSNYNWTPTLKKKRIKQTFWLMAFNVNFIWLKLRCDTRFQHAFTACSCIFKVITLVGSNQGNFFENVTACSKRTLKMTVATQLYFFFLWHCLNKTKKQINSSRYIFLA